MNKHLPFALAVGMLMVFSFSGCKNRVKVVSPEKKSENTAAIVQDTLTTEVDSIEVDSILSYRAEDYDEESLFYRNITADTVKKTNPELLALLDELYRYVGSEIYSNEKTNIDKNFQWMRNYRKKLCQYYDSHKLGPKNISVYAKADSVIEETRRLWDIEHDESTVGLVTSSNIESTRQEFQLYNAITYIYSLCDNEEQQTLLRKSFEEGLRLQDLLSNIGAKAANLQYWRGSACGLVISGVEEYIQYHFFQLYEGEKNLLRNHSTKGISLDGKLATAKKELIDACPEVLEQCYSEDNGGMWYGESLQNYRQMKKDTQELIAQLPIVLNSWIKAQEDFFQAVYPPELRKYSEQLTIDFLNETIDIFTSIPNWMGPMN